MRLIAGIYVLVLTGVMARAQASIELNMESEQVFVNEPVTVEVLIDNFRECGAPEFPAVEGLTIRALPNTSSIRQSIINGRVSNSRTFYFELKAEKTGTFEIPPVSATVDGKTLTTTPRTVTVRASDADQLLSAEIKCDDATVYVGQQTTLTMTIWIRAAKVSAEWLSYQDMFSFVEHGDWGPFPMPSPPVRTETRTASDGSKQRYYGYDCAAGYTPTKPGALNLDEIEVSMRYPTRFGRDIFGQLGASQFRRLRVTPRVQNVNVSPLPMDGRPETFNGAIGRYAIQVRAEPTRVRVGDPIKLTIDLTGDGAVAGLGPPLLASMPELNNDFRVPREALAGEMKGMIKRFTQTIRAKRADVKHIPPIEYPYFDTKAGKYVMARSEPVPISVTAAESLESAELPAVKTPDGSKDAGPVALDGLRDNVTNEAEVLASARPIGVTDVAVVALGPPVLFFVIWTIQAFTSARRGDAAGRRRSRAYAAARRRIERAGTMAAGESAREIRAALAGYLADRANEPAARFEGVAGAQFLRERGAGEDAASNWAGVVEACEQAGFGGGTNGDVAALAERAREQIGRLERVRL